jgi:hypothetical protein
MIAGPFLESNCSNVYLLLAILSKYNSPKELFIIFSKKSCDATCLIQTAVVLLGMELPCIPWSHRAFDYCRKLPMDHYPACVVHTHCPLVPLGQKVTVARA